MEPFPERRRFLDSAKGKPASHELVERIHKLRWIGMDDEAEQLRLKLCKSPSGETLLACPTETD